MATRAGAVWLRRVCVCIYRTCLSSTFSPLTQSRRESAEADVEKESACRRREVSKIRKHVRSDKVTRRNCRANYLSIDTINKYPRREATCILSRPCYNPGLVTPINFPREIFARFSPRDASERASLSLLSHETTRHHRYLSSTSSILPPGFRKRNASTTITSGVTGRNFLRVRPP